MRKIVILLLAALLLTGCTVSIKNKSGNEGQKDITVSVPDSVQDKGIESDYNDGQNAQPASARENNTAQENETAQGADVNVSAETDAENSPVVQSNWNTSVSRDSITENWYVGMIGNAKIHARFDISDYKVTGSYYYDKYKSEIPLDGYIDDGIRGMLWMRLTEDTDKKGSIYALFRADEYIQGFWKSGDTIYPMYLIKEGANVEPPKPAGDEALAYKGLWYGSRSYYSGGEVTFTPLFSDLLFYDLSAYSGAHSGSLESFGIIEKDGLNTVFIDNAYESNENVVFSFKLKDKALVLDSNMYDYMCGMGVAFSAEYTRERPDVPMPTAQDAGIVDSEEMEKAFREITGEDFGNFIAYTQFVQYEDVTIDGRPAKAGKSYLRGMAGMCFYIVADNKIYAAYTDYENIRYYTNDKKYADNMPEPMKGWASVQDVKIQYNYKETK